MEALGVVELTIALHRVFRSPEDVLVFDTGHQSYVHKMLTGRLDDFDRLRQEDGLSGYPSRDESPHDVVENSHASTALSWVDGIAKGLERTGELGTRHVVGVIGDGALTGGMAWEALNNIAASDRPVVMVVNDNERSYSPTIGGLASHLATLRTTRGYEKFLDWGKVVLGRTPVIGAPLYDTLHGVKKGLKDVVAPQGMFEDLGLKYVGPVDGHDIEALERTLERAKDYPGPVLVHVITEKGRGYLPAELDDAEVGAEVPAGAADLLDELGADLLREGRQLVGRQRAQVARGADAPEQRHGPSLGSGGGLARRGAAPPQVRRSRRGAGPGPRTRPRRAGRRAGARRPPRPHRAGWSRRRAPARPG